MEALHSLQPELDQFIARALEEDVREGDHSSNACIPAEEEGTARLFVKDDGVLAGMALAQYIFWKEDPEIRFEKYLEDGAQVKKGDVAFQVTGRIRTILKLERLVLNCMQRMSGIATRTAQLVSLIEGTGTRILDTRKTTPGIRFLEKWAVRIGGGYNHRFGLYDMIMLKDNHVDAAGGIRQAIERTLQYLKEKNLDLRIEVETRNINEVKQVLETGGIDRIMLDNYTPDQLKEAVLLIGGKYETEASGGITDSNICAFAQTGIDFISTSQMTHSVKSLDLSLKIVK